MADKTMKRPSIPEWFSGREVLVTGGTGFMGKVILAKLLMGCPNIKTIYVIIRDKNGISPKNRLTNLLQAEPFRVLRENHPQRLKKLLAVTGDTTVHGMGLSESDAQILKNNVSVLINMAANVRFDLTLKNAVNINTQGTANVIAFAKQFTKLDSFIHTSTAYCHCSESVLEEKFYPVSMSPEEVIKMVNAMDDEHLESLAPKLLGDQPNTYAFTKALSEDLVRRCGLPAGIARPSIVIGSFKEPDSGWVDNMNGPTGLMIGAGKGVIRSMLGHPQYYIDVFPCDMAINAIIALAWKVGCDRPNTPHIVNLTESGDNPITWQYAIETGKKHATANPFSDPLWYPGGTFTSSKIIHSILVLLFHTIPAYFLDGLIILTGNKPFLVRVQKKVTYGINLVYYYTTKNWIFKNDMLKELRKSLNPEDQQVFFMDMKVIKWDDYLLSYILATRKYCLKDDPSTLPKARRVFAYLYVIDRTVKVLFTLLCAWVIYSWLLSTKSNVSTDFDAILMA